MYSTTSTNGGGFFSGLAKMLVAIILIGGIGGILVSNLPKQLAEAHRVQAETEWETRVREQVDLQYLEDERALEYWKNKKMTDLAIARQTEELRLEKLQHEQVVRTEAMLQYAAVFLLLLLGCSLVVIMTVTLSRAGWLLAEHMQARPTKHATMPNGSNGKVSSIRFFAVKRPAGKKS